MAAKGDKIHPGAPPLETTGPTPAVSWKDLSYTIELADKSKLNILDRCGGEVFPGEVCGIMGPSGSGKTTLVDLLGKRISGDKKGRELKGTVTNRCKLVRSVQQVESLAGTLTVRETLSFAARLAGMPLDHVEVLLGDMGLTTAANTQVGTVFKKGLSGGQRRRLSVAVELVSNPTLLLLDEPTSGLDSASAWHVLQHIKTWAQVRGCAVVTTLHAPSFDIWNLLDVTGFLSEGKLVYFGLPGAHLMHFFAAAGYILPMNANISDSVLSLTNMDFKESGLPIAHLGKLVEDYQMYRQNMLQSGDYFRDRLPAHQAFIDTNEEDDILIYVGKNGNTMVIRASFWKRLLVLMERNFIELIRDPGIIGVRILMYTCLSITIGAMYLGVGKERTQSSITGRVGVLFYVAAFMVFMSVAAVPAFVMQRSVFTKERFNGAYGAPEYCLAKFLVSIPGLLVLAFVCSIIIVLPAQLNGFWVYLATLFSSLLMAEAFMFLVASLVPHYIIGIVGASGLFGFFMLCCGFFIVQHDIPVFLKWGYYIAPHTYIFRIFMINEFKSINEFDSARFSDDQDDGMAVLRFYHMDHYELANDFIPLLGYVVLFNILFTLVLHYRHTGIQ